MYRRRRAQPFILLAVIIAAVLILFIVVRALFSSPDEQAENVVEDFYEYEQDGDFSSSWELFHSSMKEKFSKGHYIQDRAHVFMNHFGVDTFRYELSEPEEVENWQMSEEADALKTVYSMTVTQTFKGKYGNFDIEQEVFAVEEKEEWKILWDYNR